MEGKGETHKREGMGTGLEYHTVAFRYDEDRMSFVFGNQKALCSSFQKNGQVKSYVTEAYEPPGK